jgi:hypothetical protein
VNNHRRWQLNREREGEEMLRHHLPGAEVQIETGSDTEFAKPTVAKVLAEFLAEQQKRLSARNFSRYRLRFQLFEQSLNSYAHQALLEADAELFNRLYNSEGDAHR